MAGRVHAADRLGNVLAVLLALLMWSTPVSRRGSHSSLMGQTPRQPLRRKVTGKLVETVVPSAPQNLDVDTLRPRIDALLDRFLNDRVRAAGQSQQGMGELAQEVRDFVARGGKRLRPLLCVLGWCAGGERAHPPEAVLRAAAALELFHAFALIHDDVMDDSHFRRGRPTVHRAMAARHAVSRSPRAAERLGLGAAILAGDLALAWSDELLHGAGLPPTQLAAALSVIDAMRAEIVYGQYLDLTAAATAACTVEAALKVAQYKTAKYTVERPLHLGAVLGGDAQGLREALSAYALPVGEAFQLRDDLLGVFGEPQVTGKPTLDDLRDAKPTVLLALALERATPAQTALLHDLVGRGDLDEEGAAQVRRVLIQTGAVDTVESMIGERYRKALAAADAAVIHPAARTALRRMADAAVRRHV